MREELRKKLADNRARLVSELEVSTSFLNLLVNIGVIKARHMYEIEVKATPHSKVDTLIDILERRSDAMFQLFCDVLHRQNSDLFHLLVESEEVTASSQQHEPKQRYRADKEDYPTKLAKQNIGILGQLREYVDGTDETKLDAEQKLLIEKFLNKDKKRTKFVGIFLTNSLSLYFQYATHFLHEWLTKSSAQKIELKNLYQILQPQLKTLPSFDVDIKMTNSSKIHSIFTAVCDSGMTAKPPTDAAEDNSHTIPREDKPLVIVEFSKLVVGEIIGAGGYGKVYEARHPDLQGTVAYKQINADFIQQSEEAELIDEARIHMRLDHPNIVKCFAVVFEPEHYGMILEFMIHGTAKNYLKKNNFLRSKLKIIKDVAAGMKYLHSIKPHPVIHGDLKSENILIGENEIAKVCDFGFSRWKEYSTSHSVQTVPLGTVTHVPPERWRDCNLRKNEKFDVYSFGITMWEILTLKSPFAGGRPAQIQVWVENGQRPDLELIPVEVAKTVVDLMVECWDGDKLERPPFEDILPKLGREFEIL